MGVEYRIACKTCKIVRDLDKFYAATIYPVSNRKEALEFQEKIKKDAFRAGLLVSFLGQHQDHECVFSSEYNESFDTYNHETDEPTEYKSDINFFVNNLETANE